MKNHGLSFIFRIVLVLICMCFIFSSCKLQFSKEGDVAPIDLGDYDLTSKVVDFVERYGIDGLNKDSADLYMAYAIISSLGQYNYIHSISELYSSAVSTGGFGIIVSRNFYNEVYVDQILPGSPMLEESNGVKLQRGDEIYAINGNRVSGASNDYFVALNASINVGDVVSFTIKRNGEILSAEPSWEKIDFNFPQCYYINDLPGVNSDFGYIMLRSFSNAYSTIFNEIENAVKSFNNDGNKALILDLRGNGGGNSAVLEKMASYFIGAPTGKYEKLVEVSMTKLGKTNVYGTYASSDYIKTPIYVLTDGNTASASEALIGIMKAHGTLTKQIGCPTVGKGVAQNGYVAYSTDEEGCIVDEITDDSGNKITGGVYFLQVVVGKYYIYDNSYDGGKYCMHGVPFVPDIIINEAKIIKPDYSLDQCIAAAILDFENK